MTPTPTTAFPFSVSFHFSHTLVHRCRPRAVVDLFLLSIVSFVFPSSLLTGNLCPPFFLSRPFSLPFARLGQVISHIAWILCSRPYGKTRENPSRSSFSGAAFEHLRGTPRSTNEQYFSGDIRLPEHRASRPVQLANRVPIIYSVTTQQER